MRPMDTLPPRPFLRSLWRGLKERCPHCGEGKLFWRYLKVSPKCPVCAHDLDQYPSDDGPAYFTILIVGHVVIAPGLFFFAPLIWNYPPVIVVPSLLIPVAALTLFVLPRIKGAVVGALYALSITRGDAALHTADRAD